MPKTEINTPQMCGRIVTAAYKMFPGAGPFDAYFEHGQWWLFDIGRDRTFSVVDAEGGTSVDGFDFEEVSRDEA
ncbi:MAG: hypothetical protein AB7I29_15170 [Geobacter sp.]